MDTHSLARTQAEAQAQALAFQGIRSEATARNPPARPPRAALAAAALAALLGGAAAAYAMIRPAAQPVAVPEAATPARHPARLWETSADELPAEELQAPATPPAVRAASAASAPAERGALAVRLVDGELRIEARGASRRDAARLLAELTGSALLGEPDTLVQAQPLNLHWSGRDLRDAWRAVLGDEVSNGLQCAARDACRVWILGPAPVNTNQSAIATDAAPARFVPPSQS